MSNGYDPHSKRPYCSETSSPLQLLSSHEEGGQRWLTDRERKSRPWPAIAMETFDLQVCVQQERKKRRNGCIFFSLIAQSGFSNVLLWNRNIEGIDQLSCAPCLWDIAAFLCNKRRKWKQTKKNITPGQISNFHVIKTSMHWQSRVFVKLACYVITLCDDLSELVLCFLILLFK